MKKKIYISLPISGTDLHKTREYADLVKAALSKEGFEPVNPFDIYAGKNPDYHDHLAADIRALLDCDGIMLCRGWEKSFGCGLEAMTALHMMNCGGRTDLLIMYDSIETERMFGNDEEVSYERPC